MISQTNSFRKEVTSIKDLIVLQKNKFSDTRGTFTKLFSIQEFIDLGIKVSLESINYSYTKKKGTFRGFHFQNYPHSELKVVSCIKGEIIDYCIDLRKDSSTFFSYHSQILSEANNNSLVIPKGCAHGFQSLTDDCQLIYMHSTSYNKESEGGINILDPLLKITLPIEISEISERDKNFKFITSDFLGIKVNEM